MYLIPLVGTLMASVFAGALAGRSLGHRGVIVFSISCLVISFLGSCYI